jgi:dipeptidyl aminopeptidase/acylaminoacyl peptidase
VISADPAWSHGGSFQNLLGKKARTPEDIEKFSLDRHVTAATPPAFLWHTAADNCVPVMNSLLYATALAKAGVPFEAHIYPKGDHGLATCDEQTNEKIPFEVRHAQTWLDSARKWLKLMFG